MFLEAHFAKETLTRLNISIEAETYKKKQKIYQIINKRTKQIISLKKNKKNHASYFAPQCHGTKISTNKIQWRDLCDMSQVR